MAVAVGAAVAVAVAVAVGRRPSAVGRRRSGVAVASRSASRSAVAVGGRRGRGGGGSRGRRPSRWRWRCRRGRRRGRRRRRRRGRRRRSGSARASASASGSGSGVGTSEQSIVIASSRFATAEVALIVRGMTSAWTFRPQSPGASGNDASQPVTPMYSKSGGVPSLPNEPSTSLSLFPSLTKLSESLGRMIQFGRSRRRRTSCSCRSRSAHKPRQDALVRPARLVHVSQEVVAAIPLTRGAIDGDAGGIEDADRFGRTNGGRDDEGGQQRGDHRERRVRRIERRRYDSSRIIGPPGQRDRCQDFPSVWVEGA